MEEGALEEEAEQEQDELKEAVAAAAMGFRVRLII